MLRGDKGGSYLGSKSSLIYFVLPFLWLAGNKTNAQQWFLYFSRVCARHFLNGVLEPYGMHWSIIDYSRYYTFFASQPDLRKKKPADFCINANCFFNNHVWNPKCREKWYRLMLLPNAEKKTHLSLFWIKSCLINIFLIAKQSKQFFGKKNPF